MTCGVVQCLVVLALRHRDGDSIWIFFNIYSYKQEINEPGISENKEEIIIWGSVVWRVYETVF